MSRKVGYLLVLSAGALVFASPAHAHSDICHPHYTCPSDHHSYVWQDPSGDAMDCAEEGALEYDPQQDVIEFEQPATGMVWYCNSTAAAPKPPNPGSESTPPIYEGRPQALNPDDWTEYGPYDQITLTTDGTPTDLAYVRIKVSTSSATGADGTLRAHD